jgi:hypothetical protein
MDPNGLRKAQGARGIGRGHGPHRGPRTVFYDPLSLQYALGYKDRRYSLTYDTLKRISIQLSLIASIINTRIAQIASFSEPYRLTKSLGFQIRHKDTDHETTRAEKDFIKQLEAFILSCGEPGQRNPYTRMKRPKFESFLKTVVRDSLTYDQVGFEVVPRRNQIPFEFWPVDATTLRIATPDRDAGMQFSYHHRTPICGYMQPHRFHNLYEGQRYGEQAPMGEPVQYVQVVNGQIENVYTDAEIAFGVRNPRSDIYIQGYGFGELEQLITIVTATLHAEEYNRRFFMQGAHPKGMLNFKGDNWSPDQLEAFKRMWVGQIAGSENCVDGSTVIWTPKGASSIRDVVGDGKEKEINIWTGTEWCPALAYKTKESKQLVETKLWNGLTVSTSPDHKFRILGDEGPEWRRQEDLEVGDYVLVNKQSPIGEKSVPSFQGRSLTPEMLEVLGWMIGDGYLSKSSMSLFYHPSKETEVRLRHLKILHKFDLPAKSRDKHLSLDEIEEICERYNFQTVSSVRLSIQLASVEFVRWLSQIGFQPSRLGKVIPGFVFVLPNEHKAAFLRGFFSADGNLAKGRHPAITITNDTLREQTRLLLISFGIRTNLSEGKTKLTIKGRKRGRIKAKSVLRVKDRDRFLKVVGFIQDHKQPVEMKHGQDTQG